MLNRIGAACLIAGLFAASAAADEEIQWQQVLDIPKRANLGPDIAWDVLGIAPGDTYKSVRPKLDALLAESIPQTPPKNKMTAQLLGQDTSPPLEEIKLSIMLPMASGQGIKATYVDRTELKRQLKGTGPRPIDDNLTVRFSTPASGNQVISLRRSIFYWEHEDQVRISEMIKSIAAKYGATPRIMKSGSSTTITYIYDKGKLFTPADVREECGRGMPMNINDIEQINHSGRCDVVLDVTMGHGISDDHASNVVFYLDDYARGKQNLTADRSFFDSYVNDVRSRTAGQAPKL